MLPTPSTATAPGRAGCKPSRATLNKAPTCPRPARVDDALAQRALQQAESKLHQEVLVQRRRALAAIVAAPACGVGVCGGGARVGSTTMQDRIEDRIGDNHNARHASGGYVARHATSRAPQPTPA